jgi:hypothetical protein
MNSPHQASGPEQFSIDETLAAGRVRIEAPMLQWKTELEEFCRFMIRNSVRSFLEIGAGDGQLSVFMKDGLCLDRACACDLHCAPLLAQRRDIAFYHGDHQAPEYRNWRAMQGTIDMVFIDANHKTGFRGDYEVELQFPHRFIAFHDIANRAYPQLGEFWKNEVSGGKIAFENRDATIGFGVPELKYPFRWIPSAHWLEQECGRSCGIGVCWTGDDPV